MSALTCCITVTAAVPEAAPAVAVTVAVPLATAVTSPDAPTVATEASLDSHDTSVPATARPFASTASATRRTVSPTATRVSAAGVTLSALTCCITVTAAVPEAPPAVAVIVAVPLATAVTSPDASTVATEGSLLAHATAAPAITCPFWSRTSAVNCAVSPKAVSVAEPGLTVTVVATGAGGGGAGSTVPSPHDSTSITMTAMAVTEILKSALSRPRQRRRFGRYCVGDVHQSFGNCISASRQPRLEPPG